MKQAKSWFYTDPDTRLMRKQLMSEICRIASLKIPAADRMRQIRSLIDDYFRKGCNEEFLNANLP